MPYIDLHCDTLSALLFRKRAQENADLCENDLHIDLQKLRRAGCLLQTFALFCDTEASRHPLSDCLAQIDLFYQSLSSHPDKLMQVTSASDLRRARALGRIGAMLSLEDAAICEHDFSVLSILCRLGVRMTTLTWNHENALAAPRASAKGLSALGRDFVSYAQSLGILIDLSHLSDRGVYDVLSMTKAPVLASHSNARTLCPHPRNLTDDMIRKIGNCGGVIGVNFYPPFLESDAQSASWDAVCRHISHIAKVGGIGCVAIGSDFDGFGQNPEIPNAQAFAQLHAVLCRNGFSASDADGILWKNAWRVLKEVL